MVQEISEHFACEAASSLRGIGLSQPESCEWREVGHAFSQRGPGTDEHGLVQQMDRRPLPGQASTRRPSVDRLVGHASDRCWFSRLYDERRRMMGGKSLCATEPQAADQSRASVVRRSAIRASTVAQDLPDQVAAEQQTSEATAPAETRTSANWAAVAAHGILHMLCLLTRCLPRRSPGHLRSLREKIRANRGPRFRESS